MDLIRNPFKAAIAAGQQQIGIWCSIPALAMRNRSPAAASTGC